MIIGNKNHFSFELEEMSQPNELLDFSFYLGNKLISNEPVYVQSYLASIQDFIDNVHKEYFKSSSPEINYTSLFKKWNLQENEYSKHLFYLDETIDQYSIFIFQTNEVIRFVWICWDENNCNLDHELNKIYTVHFSIQELITTVNKLIDKLQKLIEDEQ